MSEVEPEEFRAALRRENHTLKRALTDPKIVSGIGNAYSDEILHRARLSPFKQTRDAGQRRDAPAARGGRDRCSGNGPTALRAEPGRRSPRRSPPSATDMAVHGRFGEAVPGLRHDVQRIVYAENECDYCPGCQTEGRMLADRSLVAASQGRLASHGATRPKRSSQCIACRPTTLLRNDFRTQELGGRIASSVERRWSQ